MSQAEAEFAVFTGRKYAVAVNSCSSAILLALITAGVKAGDQVEPNPIFDFVWPALTSCTSSQPAQVITNGFTFTALPSTILRLGAIPVLVETTRRYGSLHLSEAAHQCPSVCSWTMNISDLEGKLKSSGAKVVLLSHMRGKVDFSTYYSCPVTDVG